MAPKSLGAQYLAQIRSGTTVLSIIWFLYLYKRNMFSRIVSGRSLSQADRERYLTMDRISSIGLLVLGCMALAESCGVAVQSVMTVGGIGGKDLHKICMNRLSPSRSDSTKENLDMDVLEGSIADGHRNEDILYSKLVLNFHSFEARY